MSDELIYSCKRETKTKRTGRKELNNMKMIERFKYLRDHDLETLYEINVHL